MNRPVTQDWTHALSMMQQSVLLTALRGPDGIRKDHVAKLIIRWLRRCVLISAFDREVLPTPRDQRGGSFTGPSLPPQYGPLDRKHWVDDMNTIVTQYINAGDELPAHFLSHIKNAVQILGYKHPDAEIRGFWHTFYLRLVDSHHDNPETAEQMGRRLGDNEADWVAQGERQTSGRAKLGELVAADAARKYGPGCRQEHDVVMRAAGVPVEGDGQEHDAVMREILK